MVRKSWELFAVSAVAIVAMLSALAGLPQWPGMALLGALLALVLPGYAWAAALLPDLDWVEHLLLALGLSLVFDVIGGLVLQITPWGLQPATWSVWAGGLTLVASGSAAWRRRAQPDRERPQLKVTPGQILALLLTAGIITVAVGTAQYSAQQKERPFTQFWALPVAEGETWALEIGLHNQENRTLQYNVYMESNGSSLGEWSSIEVPAGGEWTRRVSLSEIPAHLVRVLLFRADNPDEIYRLVQIAPAAFAALSTSTPVVP